MFPPFNFSFNSNRQQEDPKKRFFANLFPPPPEQANPYSRTSDESNEIAPTQPGFMDVYKELMNRQSGPAMSAYRKFVEAPSPTRDDFKPSKMTRLGAILSGAAAGFTNPSEGVNVTRSILDRGFNEGMRRYADEGGRLRESANLEELDYKNKVGAVKAVGDIQDKERDNQRQDALANSLIGQRKLTAKETAQRIEANGATFHEDKTTGIGYLVKRDGSRIPVGKFDQSTGERLEADLSKMREQDKLVGTRQVKLANVNFGNQKALQDDRQKHDVTMEDKRQTNRISLTGERAKKAAELAAIKIKAPVGAAIVIKNNIPAVQSMIDADPNKYEGLWDSDTGSLIDTPSTDDPNYPAFVQLYNTLYKGINQLGVKVTKSGNSFSR